MNRQQYFDLYCLIAMVIIVGVLGWWVYDTLINYQTDWSVM